jgi:hypothetical protein
MAATIDARPAVLPHKPNALTLKHLHEIVDVPCRSATASPVRQKLRMLAFRSAPRPCK